MPLKLNSSGGGSVTLDVPSTASEYTATIPAVTGTVVTSGDTGSVSTTMLADDAVTPAKLSQPMTFETAKTAVGTETSLEFTSIPSWVKRITLIYNGVSTNGTNVVIVQIGSGSYTTTGYIGAGVNILSTVAAVTNSSGFSIDAAASAAAIRMGQFVLTNLTGNTWVASGTGGRDSVGLVTACGGSITLSGVLDRVRLTSVGTTDTFDSTSVVNIVYEG